MFHTPDTEIDQQTSNQQQQQQDGTRPVTQQLSPFLYPSSPHSKRPRPSHKLFVVGTVPSFQSNPSRPSIQPSRGYRIPSKTLSKRSRREGILQLVHLVGSFSSTGSGSVELKPPLFIDTSPNTDPVIPIVMAFPSSTPLPCTPLGPLPPQLSVTRSTKSSQRAWISTSGP
ncbi:hypothetical protein VTJ04DRAFT_8668 [Mycothermus thermophilus]|uniref:uncharacterized protein n=1 Tax=Humicola insolens TaxID=85995 RepID=UPI003742BF90